MGSPYSDEIKSAVMAALLTGQSISQVAAAYSIPVGTIKGWSARKTELVEPQKKHEIGDLVIECLRTELQMLIAQAKVMSDATWLKKQSASELGVSRGISFDKAIRLLEALGQAEQGDDAA